MIGDELGRTVPPAPSVPTLATSVLRASIVKPIDMGADADLGEAT